MHPRASGQPRPSGSPARAPRPRGPRRAALHARRATRSERTGAPPHPAAGRGRRARPRARRRRPRARPPPPRAPRGPPTAAPASCGVRARLRFAARRPPPCAPSSAARSSDATRARKRRDLPCELLGALRRGRLQGEGPEPLAHLLLDVAGALDLGRDPGELQLGAMAAPLELPEPGRLLDQRAPVLGLRREDRVDLSLRDDRVHRPAEADIREQLDEIGAANRCAVDEVLALAAPDETPRDRHLAEIELLAEPTVLVVEHELDLAVVGGGPGRRAAEEDVVGPVGTKLGRRQRARRPHDRVGHVRLAGPVRADHDGNPGLEGHLDGVGERLEAAQLDGAQVHRPGSIAAAADGDQPSFAVGIAGRRDRASA